MGVSVDYLLLLVLLNPSAHISVICVIIFLILVIHLLFLITLKVFLKILIFDFFFVFYDTANLLIQRILRFDMFAALHRARAHPPLFAAAFLAHRFFGQILLVYLKPIYRQLRLRNFDRYLSSFQYLFSLIFLLFECLWQYTASARCLIR